MAKTSWAGFAVGVALGVVSVVLGCLATEFFIEWRYRHLGGKRRRQS